MSFIFIAGDYVYKTKKPVNLGYLDYTTLEKRHYFCRRELELNQRLSPEVYLEVVPITQDGDDFALSGKGEAVEYAVKMRRLPQESMMDALLGEGRVTTEMVARVAEKLSAFHRSAETSADISAFGGLDTVTGNAEENFTQTEKYIGATIPQDTYQGIKCYTEGFIRDNAALFQRRVEEGRIRDCHGDLHAAHVCFTDGIYIYDCIEFNDRFRYCDVASEIAFLAMDLDKYQRPDLSDAFVDAYVSHSGDKELKQLLGFYKCYRAYVRGKVACFTHDATNISEGERGQALAAARSYFELAESYV